IRPFEADDGAYVRADAGGYQFLLDYRERADSFAEIPFSALLAGEFDRRLVKDRIALVGVTAESVKDSFYTPYSGTFGAKEATFGIALHGHMLSQLLRAALADERPIAVLTDSLEALLTLLWCLLGAVLPFMVRSAWRFALAVAAGLALLALAAHAVFTAGGWIPLVPPALMGWLYGFMEAITPIVGAHGGVILRFSGDSIMAVFGVPVARTRDDDIARDAVNAVDCALAMQRRLIALNVDLESRGLPLIGMRIGILTGPVTAGSLGTEQRMEYNVHGDTVNTSARLESFQRERFTPDYLHA